MGESPWAQRIPKASPNVIDVRGRYAKHVLHSGRTDQRCDSLMPESRPPDADHGLGPRFSAHDDRYCKSTRKPLREDFLIVLLAATTTVVCRFLLEVAARLAATSASSRSVADDQTWSEPASDKQIPKQ